MTLKKAHVVLAAASLLATSAALAAWPERPVKIIVPAAAGSSPDILTRLFGNELAKKLNQPVVVENRPGAAGNIGMQALMTAAPDGYTLAYGNNATLTTNEFLFSKLPYDPARLEPIALLVRTPSVLVVSASSPIKSVRELISLSKQSANKQFSFGSGGTGTSGHLAAELMKTQTGMRGQHIPYKGAPQAMNDLMGGNIEFMFDNMASAMPNVTGGKLRALAVTTKERSKVYPDIPTMDEAGVPGFEITAWGGFMAPPNTPQDIVLRINKDLNDILKDPRTLQQLNQLAFMPMGGTPAQLRELISTERVKWGEVVRQSGAKID
ncbi:MAG: tripartite tricarboxylate transporter substrate binding protein [Acidovorax sp.]|jgi:tripartite-type tricarboxylate transporter receptor subunit TctC|nr:tripartite tricarboxylate transporter substrate binding protein [Acidovorax sp.]